MEHYPGLSWWAHSNTNLSEIKTSTHSQSLKVENLSKLWSDRCEEEENSKRYNITGFDVERRGHIEGSKQPIKEEEGKKMDSLFSPSRKECSPIDTLILAL